MEVGARATWNANPIPVVDGLDFEDYAILRMCCDTSRTGASPITEHSMQATTNSAAASGTGKQTGGEVGVVRMGGRLRSGQGRRSAAIGGGWRVALGCSGGWRRAGAWKAGKMRGRVVRRGGWDGGRARRSASRLGGCEGVQALQVPSSPGRD